MKPCRIVALVVFVLLSAVQVRADLIQPGDPSVKTGGGGGGIGVPSTSTSFSISSPSGTSPGTSDCYLNGVTDVPDCLLQNEITAGAIGQTITQLTFSVSDADFSGTLTCGLSTVFGGISPYFTMCTTSDPLEVTSTVTFFGGSGIPYLGAFSLEFDDFSPDTTFHGTAATAATVPEPGTLTLTLTFLVVGALLGRRRFRPW